MKDADIVDHLVEVVEKKAAEIEAGKQRDSAAPERKSAAHSLSEAID
jgi:hypothetical protein